ncbi:MAG: cytochrome c biogenesis protein CcsA [Proteiniphilum sp.]
MPFSRRIFNILSSYTATLILLSMYAVLLALATLVEVRAGSSAAYSWFYGNTLFVIFQGLLVLNFVCVIVRRNFFKRKKWGMLILHASFVIILSGALVTYCFGKEGMVHLKEGEKTSQMMITYRKTPEKVSAVDLPFEIELLDFRLKRYPGSGSPSSFESDLRIYADGNVSEEHLYMNKVVRRKGYRIYQASYDADEKGSIMSLNHDPMGMGVSYAGYALLLVGVLIILFGKNSRFQMLTGRLKRKVTAMILLLLGCYSVPVVYAGPVASVTSVFSASAMLAIQKGGMYSYAPPKEHAEKFSKLLILNSSGRTEPVNTYSKQILRKIHRSDDFEGLTSDQVLLGMMAWPEQWAEIPLIRQGNKELNRKLGLYEKYISFNSLFNAEGDYKLTSLLDEVFAKPEKERSRLEKDLLKLDDKVNLMFAIFERRMLPVMPLPGDVQQRWFSPGDDLSLFSGMDSMVVSRVPQGYFTELRMSGTNLANADKMLDMISKYQRSRAGIELPSEKKVAVELMYNKTDLFNKLYLCYMILGVVLLFMALSGITNPSAGVNKLFRIGVVLAILGFVLHAINFGVRWYVSEQPPWSNSYESMVWISWIAILGGLFFVKRSPLTFSLSLLLGGMIMFVAHLNWMDPEITPLVPVLKSPWLMLHVSVITASYGFLGMSCLLGLFNIFAGLRPAKTGKTVEELTVINELSMTIGLCLLSLGIFTGAIWANESWGRYWGWDPKETWALITMIVYAIVLHMRLVPRFNSIVAFNIGSVFALLAVLMTFFGVNYLMGGLHSYGNSEIPFSIFMILGVYFLILIVSIYVVRINKGKPNHSFENK